MEIKKYILLLGCAMFSVFSGCENNPPQAAAKPLADRKITMIYQARVVSSPEQLKGIKALDWNKLKINSKEDFLQIFEYASEIKNVNIADFTPPAKALHGKVFTSMQQIGDLPVYGSLVRVQTLKDGHIRSIEYNFSETARKLRAVPQKFPESLSKSLLQKTAGGKLVNHQSMIYDPVLTNSTGEAQLIWYVELHSNDTPVARYFITQKGHKVLRTIPMRYTRE